ncbi:hypothetical protein HY251_12805 [bacterium]|nr:hypothetical protein [bacterium]
MPERDRVKRALAFLAAFFVLAGLGVGAWIARQLSLEEIEKERRADRAIGRRAPVVVVAGERAIYLKEAESAGVRCSVVSEALASEEETAPGEIVIAPGGAHEVRAPFAGVLARAGPPLAAGLEVSSGEKLFTLVPHVSPDARFELALKRVAAEADREKARAELDTAEKAFSRDEVLVQDGSVAPRVRDESRTRVASARASVDEADRRTLSLVALEKRSGFDAAEIEAPATWTIARLEVASGARVQAGDLLLAIDERGATRARVDLSPSSRVRSRPPEEATIVFPALGNAERKGTLSGVEPRVRPGTLALGALYAMDDGAPPPRPGEPIVARLATRPSEKCARVPASALLVRDGETWAYVRLAPGTFARRKITLLARSGDSALVTGVAGNAEVVEHGAAVLLAEELKPLIVVESEGGMPDEDSQEKKVEEKEKKREPEKKPRKHEKDGDDD